MASEDVLAQPPVLQPSLPSSSADTLAATGRAELEIVTTSQDPRRPPTPEQSAPASNGLPVQGDTHPPRPNVDSGVRGAPQQAFAGDLWGAVKRRRWVFLQALLVVPLVALALSLVQEETYTATASLLFRESPTVLQNEDQGSFNDPSREAATNEELIALPVVAGRAARELRGPLSAEAVEDSVTIESTGDANLVEIRATAETAQLAARVANAYGDAYIDFRRRADRRQIEDAIALVERSLAGLSAAESAEQGGELRRRRDELQLARSLQTGNAELVQRADVPTSRSSPNLSRNVALGLLFGVLVGLALAYLLDRADRRLKTVEELEEVYNLPVLARIPRTRSLGRGAVPGDQQLPMDKDELEVFRTLRANLRFFNVDDPIRSVLIASPLAGDGKSTVARMLAMTMAAMGDQVVLVEADLHKPGLGSAEATRPDAGLSSLLSGATLQDSIRPMPVILSDGRRGSLATVPSGPPPPNPSQLLESARMQSVLRALENRYETVIVDSPALGLISDALALVPAVSGVILVSGVGQTSRDAALDTRKQITLLGGRILGVVANFADTQPRGGYYYARQHTAAAASR